MSERLNLDNIETDSIVRQLYQTYPEGIMVLDSTGRIHYCNDKECQLLGYPRKEIIGKNVLGLMIESSHLNCEIYFEKLRNLESIESEFEFTSRNGSSVWVYRKCVPLTNNNNQLFRIVVYDTDITSRKNTEKKLQSLIEQVEQEQNLFVSGPVVIFKWKNEPGWPVEYVTPNVEEVFGYTAEEFINGEVAYASIIPDKDLTRVGNEVAENSNNGAARFVHLPYRIRKKDGNIIWIADYTTILKDKDQNITHYHGYILDITARIKMEEELRKSETRFRQIFDSAKDCIFIKNEFLKYTMVNKAFEGLFQQTKEEILGKSDFELFGEITGEQIEKADLEVLNGQSIEEEYCVTVNGTRHTFLVRKEPMRNINGNVTGICGIARDISDKYKTMEELRKSEERFKMALKGAELGLWDWYAITNKVITNTRWSEMLGYEPDELSHLLDKWEEMVHPEDLCHAEKAFNNHAEGKAEFYEAQYRIKHKDGHWIWVLDKGIITERDKDNKPLRATGTHLDITELKRLQDQETRAQRLEMCGKVAGQVAHDFNNLLAPLIAYPEIIKSMIDENNPAHKLINGIQTAASKISEINQELLTLGRRGNIQFEPADINDIINQTLNQFINIHEKVKIIEKLSYNIKNIKCNPAQILRVLTNLVGNALDAVKDEGLIIVSTESCDFDDNASNKFNIKPGQYIKTTVSDNGQGIPEEFAHNIFDPFFTTKKADKKRGSGLGLSIVHSVISDHAGYIDFSSKVGEGTSFYIYLPVCQEQLPLIKVDDIIGGNEKILVIDDDSSQCEVLKNILSKLGYSVHSVESGETALEYLKKNKTDLLIIDMIMPGGMDGADTLKHAHEIYPDIKAIIISGFARSERIETAIIEGAGEFVKKPFSFSDIGRAARKTLDEPAYSNNQ